MLSQWLWIIVCNAEQVVVNQVVLYLANGYVEPVIVNHGVLCWASGSELWCYAEQMAVNHGVQCWASDC